jgi:FtsH-binding integral membrane protein
LFDIAYNVGFIVPAMILSFIWVENSEPRTRIILIVSGVVFLILTGLVALWAQSIRDQFAPQDDLVEVDGEPVVPAS